MPSFVVLGQERSGTTLVQTLLNSHQDLLCRGELFDPWQIDDNGQKITDLSLVRARDALPKAFLTAAMDGADLAKPAPSRISRFAAKLTRGKRKRIGFKMLTHHHPLLFKEIIPASPDMAIIYVTRTNKLAQFASRQQVKETGRWTEARAQAPVAPKLKISPFWAAAECNRLENEDFLLSHYLEMLPNPVLQLEYASLSEGDLQAELVAFLDVSAQGLSSPLKKQGQNRVLDRFQNADEIATHFAAIEREAWLGPEI
ncbi:LPS sulfotransferase NodH [Shimia marina]|uniref:Stf0 sulfotransferase n=1 Tax=Shimia marina TaxID=321267 RepID=A0A0N7LRZ6_9RHOB|nr:hypothetical protein SHM7688_01646 [Shimia marina]SFE73643.1 LPS sulfotransferase NodH [Shimia marina]